jgi:hypothetical protein
MLDVMIDLETLDTRATSVILSIGAVKFGTVGNYGTFYRNCLFDDQIRVHNRSVSESTVRWWFDQTPEARAHLAVNPLPLAMVLAELRQWFEQDPGPVEHVWARGQDFDIAILNHAYDQYGQVKPWTYRQPRDSRTVVDDYLPLDQRPPEAGTLHNALDDALYEAECVRRVKLLLRVGNGS